MSKAQLIQATRQLPCSVVIIIATANGKQGAMTASAMFVSEIPPLVAVSIGKAFNTHQLIDKSGEFTINIISNKQVELAKKIGSSHGRDVDKFREFNIATEPATNINAPLVSGSFASMECRVRTSVWDIEGNHAIYIAEVVAFRMDKNLEPIIWVNNRYFSVGSECRL